MASRAELYSKLGYTKPTVTPILEAIYEIEEEQIWREDLWSSPHGEHWHTSFHASSFPGDNEKACARRAIYSLMNIPPRYPTDQAGRAVMEAGKDIEENIVWRFHRAGILLSDPPSAEHQMGFSDEEHWLTGSPDAVILLPKQQRPHPVEIKTKDHEVVEKMKMGQRSFDESHRHQILPYIGFVHENHELLWPDLNPATQGSILYVSRDRPHFMHEFKFNYSEKYMEAGRDKLKLWKEAYLRELLPPRSKDWKWTEPPCQWCPVKKFCKEDVKAGIENLSESNTIKHAEEVRGSYDYEETRKAVLDRWEKEGVS